MSGLALPVMPDIGVAPSPPSHPAGDTPSAILGTYARAPLTLVGGDGVELIASDGRRYLDFTSGIAVNALGYGDPGLQAVLQDAAAGLIHVSNLFRTEPAEDLAQWLVDQGIESMSLNPDTVVETWMFLAADNAAV